MAILCVFDNPNATTDLYDRVSSKIGDEVPEGGIVHVACKREGGGLFVVECWESEDAFQKWSQRIDKEIQAAGGPPRVQPKKYQVHNIRTGKAFTKT